ncbi:MAG: hypothetical protein FWB73_00375 [Treponema sp.]|nr:hypothetical protein [Treponema sp.]
MGVSPVVFETAGKRTEHLKPGVYTRRNNVASGAGSPSQNLVILGQSTGGKPRTLIPLTDISEARNALVGGNLLEGVAHAFTGSKDFVPQKVFAFRVNNGTRASLTLKSGNEEIITVRSRDYGVHTNQIKLWVKDGDAENSKKVLISYKGNEITIDDIVKKSISVLYTGSGNSADISITDKGMTLTSDKIDLAVTWEECETLEDLAARINDSGLYSAAILDVATNAKTADLDTVQKMSVKGTAATLYSNLAAFIKALQLKAGLYIGEIEVKAKAVRVVPENTDGFVYLEGATAGTYTISDWVAALELLEKENVQSISTPSDDSTVHTLIVNHCVLMSGTPKKRERQYFLGAPEGTSIEDGLALAADFNSDLGSLVINSAIKSNPLTGAKEIISPAMFACATAGMEGAMGIANPLTNKQVNVSAIVEKYTDTEMEKLIAGGIMPFGINDDGYLVVIRAMTTYQADNLASNERSCMREALYMDRDFRKAYNRRIGTNDEPSESDVIDILKKRAKIWYRMGMITKSDSGELVFGIKVRFDGDATFLEYSRYLRTPNNFIFGTANNEIYRSADAE